MKRQSLDNGEGMVQDSKSVRGEEVRADIESMGSGNVVGTRRNLVEA